MTKTFIEIRESPKLVQIDRSIKITSKEIKKVLKIEKGEITSINLWQGRSPNDIANNVSPDKDIWEINVKESNKND